ATPCPRPPSKGGPDRCTARGIASSASRAPGARRDPGGGDVEATGRPRRDEGLAEREPPADAHRLPPAGPPEIDDGPSIAERHQARAREVVAGTRLAVRALTTLGAQTRGLSKYVGVVEAARAARRGLVRESREALLDRRGGADRSLANPECVERVGEN